MRMKKKIANAASEVKQKVPIPVIVIAWLMVINGLFIFIPVLLGIVVTKVNPLQLMFKSLLTAFIGISLLFGSIGSIIIGFGIRYMRKWALYLFTFLAILIIAQAIYFLIIFPRPDITRLGSPAIQLIALIYLWSIRRKFK